MIEPSIQGKYPRARSASVCGPAKEKWLRLKSRVEGDLLVAER
jgi:hypothetical protein